MMSPKAFQPPDYEKLLSWLSDDREAATRGFLRIRCELIRIFGGRGCPIPEDLADETIDRVAKKVAEVEHTYEGDPARYFYGVARNVHREYVRRRQATTLERELGSRGQATDTAEDEAQCLDSCLGTLAPLEKGLILDYYSMDRSDKVVGRQAIASRIGLNANALRIRAYRIRKRLYDCVTQCLQAVTA